MAVRVEMVALAVKAVTEEMVASAVKVDFAELSEKKRNVDLGGLVWLGGGGRVLWLRSLFFAFQISREDKIEHNVCSARA